MSDKKTIIHIVDDLGWINFGIWNAAVFGSEYLKGRHSLHSMLWVCSEPIDEKQVSIPVVFLGKRMLSSIDLKELLQRYDLIQTSALIVTHGCWLKPTRIGWRLSKLGFKWVYTPHGMLEPWSMDQKKSKKQIYFRLFEKRWSKRADVIRAVSNTEKLNLQKIYKRSVILIENGIKLPVKIKKPNGIDVYLFMARLHYKKGILPLVMAWNRVMKDLKNRKLIIAGPDEGELEKIMPYLNSTIEYVGAVYNEQKQTLLQNSHYYILPSYSEGFPTSVVEAMSNGLIPIISSGCNFPAVFQNSLGYQIEPDVDNIERVLTHLQKIEFSETLSDMARQFIAMNNSEEVIGNLLWKQYESLFSLKNSTN